MSANEILIDRGFKPVSELNYCLANGTEYYIGYHPEMKKDAAIVALITDEGSNWFIDKEGLRVMAETAKTYGIERVTLYTNYGVELHSKHDKPEVVGLSRVIKINSDGFNYGTPNKQ